MCCTPSLGIAGLTGDCVRSAGRRRRVQLAILRKVTIFALQYAGGKMGELLHQNM